VRWWVSGSAQLWYVYIFAALWGTVSAVETPARQAFVSELVPKPLLTNALALSGAAFNSARIVGPAIGGLTIAALGTGTAFVANAISYVAPLIALSRMRRPSSTATACPPRCPPPRPGSSTACVYVRQRRDLLLPLAIMLVIGMVGFNFQITLAVLAKNVFHTGRPPSACSPPASRSGRWAARWPAPAAGARPSCGWCSARRWSSESSRSRPA